MGQDMRAPHSADCHHATVAIGGVVGMSVKSRLLGLKGRDPGMVLGQGCSVCRDLMIDRGDQLVVGVGGIVSRHARLLRRAWREKTMATM